MTSVGFIISVRNQQPIECIEQSRNNVNGNKHTHHWWDVTSDYVFSSSDALQLAVMYGNKQYAEYLLENFIDECLTPACCPIIFMAIKMEADDILELLCRRVQEAQILYNGVPYIDARGCMIEEGKRPLHLAVQLGRVNACKILLKYGANPHATDIYGLTALERGLQNLILAHDEIDNLIQNAAIPDFVEKHSMFAKLKNTCESIVYNLVELCDHMVTTDRESIPYLRGLLKDCFNILPREYIGALLQLHQLMEKLFQPPSLVRNTRYAIRGHLGYRSLPDGVEKLGLPPYLSHYVLHNIKEALQAEHWQEQTW